jgi:hypothetical protein
VRKDYVPEAKALNELLAKNRMRAVTVTKVAETDVPVAAEVWELSIAGLT